MSDKISAKEIVVGVIVLAIVGGMMWYTLGLFQAESGAKVIDISQAGDDAASHIETHVKLTSIDPIKGDAAARLEFAPSDNLLGEDGTLKQDLKLYVNSANGKHAIARQDGTNFELFTALLLTRKYPAGHPGMHLSETGSIQAGSAPAKTKNNTTGYTGRDAEPQAPRPVSRLVRPHHFRASGRDPAGSPSL